MYLVEKRKIDQNGRIQIPSAMREEMNLSTDDEVMIEYKSDSRGIEIIPAKKYPTKDHCGICGKCLDKYKG
jgi:AbrB family looped-hinge helix DNA binding protein